MYVQEEVPGLLAKIPCFEPETVDVYVRRVEVSVPTEDIIALAQPLLSIREKESLSLLTEEVCYHSTLCRCV